MAIINTKIENSLLKQAEGVIEKGIPPNQRQSYMKIVVSGMKIALAGGGKSVIAEIKSAKEPVDTIVKGVIGLLSYMRMQAKGVMPIDAMIPAGMTLVLQALDFAERIGVMKVDKQTLANATQMYAIAIMAKLDITPQKLRGVVQKVHGIVTDPAKLEKLKQTYAQSEQNKQKNAAQKQSPQPAPQPAAQPAPKVPPSHGLINAGRGA